MTAVARPASRRPVTSGTAVVVAGNGIGAACILANWWQTAGADDLTANLSSAGLAIAGVLAAGLTNALWLLTMRGAIARRRRGLSGRVADWAAPLDAPPLRIAEPAATTTTTTAASGFVAVEGATRYHRPDCPLVSRKRTAVAERRAHEANGLHPCGVCEPALAGETSGAAR